VEKAKNPLISFEEERKRVWLPLRLNNLLIVCKRPHISPTSRSKSRGMEGGKKMPNPRNRNGKTQKEEKRKEVFLVKRKITLRA
jgi:hypothetical protein